MNIDKIKPDQTTQELTNDGCSYLVKKHGCGCGAVFVLMSVLSLILSILLAPFLPESEDGGLMPSNHLILLYLGVFLVILGFYWLIKKLLHCRIAVQAQRVQKDDSQMHDDYAFEYYYDGKRYQTSHVGFANANKISNDYTNTITIKINPKNPTEIFYLKSEIPVYLSLIAIGALIASPVVVLLIKSVSAGLWNGVG